MSDTLIKVENVSKKFCRSLKKSLWYGMQDMGRELVGRRHGGNGELRQDEFWAVKDVSFELKRGECLGLIGRNGAGKTTLLRMLNGLIKPDKGRIEMRGRVGALIALGAGFNPILTGRENIYVNAAVLGLRKKEVDEKIEEIVEFAELGKFIDAPVQSYSSGMSVRLGFAVATALEPDVLILDEILAVGDIGFKVKAYKRIGNLLKDAAVIFVTHSMTQVYRICDYVAVMETGKLNQYDIVNEAIEAYKYNVDSQVKLFKECKKIFHESIKNVDFYFFSNHTQNKEWLLKISAVFLKEIIVDYVIINFTNQEGLLVSEFRKKLLCKVMPSNEIQEMYFYIFNFPMKTGKYFFDFALYSNTGKSSLIHISQAGPIEMRNITLTDAVCVLDGYFFYKGNL